MAFLLAVAPPVFVAVAENHPARRPPAGTGFRFGAGD